MSTPRARILPPYMRRVDDWRHFGFRSAAVAGVLLYAMFMGFWIAIFGTIVLQPFIAVLGILFLVALWMIEDSRVNYRTWMTGIFLFFIGAVAIWPAYLAVDIPGLPWITPPRLTLAIMMFGLLLQMSQSSLARAEVVDVAKAAKPALIFYAIFWCFALGTAAVASSPMKSFTYSLNFIILWNMSFIAALWLFIDEEVMPKAVRLLMYSIAFIFVLTVFEYIQRRPIWFDHIPAFLQIDGALFGTLMQEQARLGDDRYRARGNFGVHLYFAQFVLMLVPFMVHASFVEKGKRQVAALALLLFALVICWMTNTRTAMTGYIVVVAGSVGLYALRRFLNPTSKADMVAPSLFMAAPAGIVVMGVLIALSPRLQSMTLGGAQHAGSDVVRDNQWRKAIEAITNNPLGHGGESSGPIAGRPGADGIWIVDSTWINFLVDFGVVGTAAFAIFAGLAMFYGVQLYLQRIDESTDLSGPAAVSVGSFLMTMYTISYVGSFPFFLLMIAAIFAARYRAIRDGRLQASLFGGRAAAGVQKLA
jgi:hypothetical protein